MNASMPDDPTANGYFMKENTNTCVFAAEDVSKKFGGIHALSNVTLTIGPRQIIALIGPNGAGKSTFINVVTGVYAPDTGDIHFQGRQIAGLRAHVIARVGDWPDLPTRRAFREPDGFGKCHGRMPYRGSLRYILRGVEVARGQTRRASHPASGYGKPRPDRVGPSR